MLVLVRKVDESICISDDIKITVLSTNGREVRLGIDAPKDIPVHREEVYKAIQEAHGVVKSGVNVSADERVSLSKSRSNAL